MQGKGLVKFFLVILTLVVVYQFLLIIPTRKVEANAEKFATQKVGTYNPDGLAWREANLSYLDSINKEVVLDLFIKTYTYEELKGQQLALGLDLKGGMSVVMQVDLKEMVINKSKKSQDENFRAAIAAATDRMKNTQKDYITLFAEEFKRIAPDQKLASIFALNPDLRDQINYETSDGEVVDLLREQANETVKSTFQKVKKRIDKFGVTQPNVTLDEKVNRIIVELPGIDNPERAKNYLQATAILQFFEVFRNNELQFNMQRANDALRSRENATTDGAFTDVDSTLMTFDENNIRIDSFYLANKEKIDNNNTNVLGNEGPLFKLLKLNTTGGYSQAIIGVASPRDTAAVMRMLNKKEVKANMPKEAMFRWGANFAKDYSSGEVVVTEDFGLYAVKRANTESGAYLEGDKITDARENLDADGAQYVVSLSMNPDGAKRWRKMTRDNLKREVAIALDGEVVSAPVVQSEIGDGNTQISGDFNAQTSKDLANILKVGKLDARTEVVESAVVGPSLGEDNIKSGLLSLVVGVLLVLAFMMVYYGTGGMISVIALFANILFILGSLASFGTVLTLPGIAGIVLTIGMAVDANVIIYERIREELRDGKSMLIAIKDGFSASYSAIIDANVTTLLTAFVLNYFGQGPIKGFAIVLIIGVICSLFAAVLVARLMIDAKTSNGGSISFWTNMSKNAFSNMKIDFISKSKVTAIISTVLIIAGIASIGVRGFDLGIDFKGGRSYMVQLDNAIDIDKMKSDLTPIFGGSTPLVKTFGGDNNKVEITTEYLIDDRTDNADSTVLAGLYTGLKTYTGKEFTYETFAGGEILKRSIKVGPTIADDIRISAIYATIFALLFIFFYILVRFRKWQYGLGAVAALFHDVLIVLGIFSILHGFLPFALEIDQAFIAAILTVVGYSINDTVVVFDRIREFFNTYTQKGKEEVINLAINNTISRTIITSLTTLFVVLMLFVFGGGTIKGFAFALLVGILVGTYSSVFVATPIVNKLLSDADIKRTIKKSDTKSGYVRKAVPKKETPKADS